MRSCDRCGVPTSRAEWCIDCEEVEGLKRPRRRLATLPDPEYDPPFPVPWKPSVNRFAQGEKDVAVFVEWDRGYTSKQISMMFGVPPSTVRNHLRRMKLGVYAEA